MFKPLRCAKSAGQTRTSIYGYILPCKHLVCIPCYDSCITPTGGRHLGTIHTGTCPTGTCNANFRSTNARKWSPIELNEQRVCGSVIGELVQLTDAGVGRADSPEPESGNQEEEEELGNSQQSTSLFTTASDADNAERIKFIEETANDEEDKEEDGQAVEVGSTWSEPGSGYTTPRNDTFLDLTHSSPLIISSCHSSPGNVTASAKPTRTRRRHSEIITSPSKSATRRTSNENQGPVPLERVLEAIKSKKPKRSRSQLSDVSNDGRETNRKRVWRSDEHISFSSQEKNEAHDEVYGYEARAMAKLERGDSDDEEEYSIHSSSPADAGECR